jgi:hypothetical protein
MIPFENDNVRAYTLLVRIEIVLRELLKASLEAEFGIHWRNRLPGDLLKKIKQSQTEENRPQFSYLCLGPLYYLTFGELLTVLRQKSGRAVADRLGGDCILKQLENIFVPRNAVCHCRPVSAVGLKAIETLYAEMEAALTPNGFVRIMSETDTGLDQYQAANELIRALNEMLRDFAKLPSSFALPEAFRIATVQFWWADDSLAGFGISAVEAAFRLVGEYNALPTGVGSAAIRQRFCEQRDFKTKLVNAVKELEKLKS